MRSIKRRPGADTYTPEIASKICERLANGEGLIAICRSPEMPPERTVRRWAIEDHQGFAAIYAGARDQQYRRWAEEILIISDDATLDPNDRRVRVDARKWLLSKLLPKQYGDKIEVNATISKRDPVELTDAEILAELGVGGDGVSLNNRGNPPLLEHQPDPIPISTHTPVTNKR